MRFVRRSVLKLLYLLPIAAAATAFGAAGAHAQELPTAATRRAVRAAVKITVQAPGGGRSTGSGSIIDPRGYILTNFHVVGYSTPGRGVPGTLINPNNEVRLSMVDSARDAAIDRYIGEVVRADVRLDLALIRIRRDIFGQPLGRRQRFPSIPLADTSSLRPGTRLFAFGFPLGVRTINVTSGEMSGFQMNSRNEVAWIRTDAEFNPGNSGGMLLDRRGRLVAIPTAVFSGRGTLEPIELARPVERVPRQWRRQLRRGHFDNLEVTGVPSLTVGQELVEEAVGDGGALDRPETHFYNLPTQRPLEVRVQPALHSVILSPEGRVLRRAQGTLTVRSSDPPGSMLGIIIPPRGASGGGTLSLRINVRPGHEGLPGWGDMPTPGSGQQ